MNELPPPSDSIAEKSVLASAMITDSAAAWFVSNLTPEMFYSDKNALIAQAILDEVSDKRPADISNVASRLRASGKYPDAGGSEYLSQLQAITVTAAHIEFYGQTVMRLYYCREAIKASLRLNDAVFRGDAEARDAAFDQMARTIDAGNKIGRTRFLSLHESLLNVMTRVDNKTKPPVFMFGVREIDALKCGTRKGNLVVVGARPGVGKTALLITFGINMAKAGLKVGMFVAEMSGDEVTERALAAESGVALERISKNTPDARQIRQMMDAADGMPRHHLFYSEISSPTIRDIRAFCDELKPDVLIVDYLTRCELPRAENQRVAVNHFMRQIKNLAKDSQMVGILGAQVSRNSDKENERMPLLSDLKESSAIEEEADAVILLHSPREEMAGDSPLIQLQVHLAKHRQGRTGKLLLPFQRDLMRLGEYEARSTQGGPIPSDLALSQRDHAKAAAGEYAEDEQTPF